MLYSRDIYSFWTWTLSQERLQSLQAPRSQECLGIGAYMGLYRICCHGHRFTYPIAPQPICRGCWSNLPMTARTTSMFSTSWWSFRKRAVVFWHQRLPAETCIHGVVSQPWSFLGVNIIYATLLPQHPHRVQLPATPAGSPEIWATWHLCRVHQDGCAS